MAERGPSKIAFGSACERWTGCSTGAATNQPSSMDSLVVVVPKASQLQLPRSDSMPARCALLLFCIPTALLAQTPGKYGDAIRAIDALVEGERQDSGIPGISVAIVEDQTLLWSKGFGHADL